MAETGGKRPVKQVSHDAATQETLSSLNSSVSSLQSSASGEVNHNAKLASPASPAPAIQSSGPYSPHQPSPSATNLASPASMSALVCNVHKTTGERPRGMIGTSTTISGDKLYVFGGRSTSEQNTMISCDLYELNLLRRHWTKLQTKGTPPAPRYFHSVCALGDTKLVCYGGMTPVQKAFTYGSGSRSQTDPGLHVLSDVHIYDITTSTWTAISAKSAPTGRYAHCATILPSSTVFTSSSAHLSAIQHNPSSGQNQGSLGVSIDGSGGAQMVIVGGQDDANKYIEQISIFNLRSLGWTSPSPVDRAYGAYRSIVTPLTGLKSSEIGTEVLSDEEVNEDSDRNGWGPAALIYSNYNFLDVKIELHIRQPNGTMIEKQTEGQLCPPGLRFPTGGIIDGHFVVSGIHMTTSKQEYMVWALDLRNMLWKKIDTGLSMSSGSWNRGILWARRNSFVILGDCKRRLVDDYNKRRVNFTNICVLELEAFGLYSNPSAAFPTSNFSSASSPRGFDAAVIPIAGQVPSLAGKSLGRLIGSLRDLSDMDLLAIGGERIPVNSHLVGRRWGPYFYKLLHDGTSETDATVHSVSTESNGHVEMTTKHPIPGSGTSARLSPKINAMQQPRLLYLPHTVHILRALTHYLYTNHLPPPQSPLSNAQILCSLLQLARPYRINGLLEATVERLHEILDGRNTAAIFNAAAMACGGGDGLRVRVHDSTEGDLSTTIPILPYGTEQLESFSDQTPAASRRDTSVEVASDTDDDEEEGDEEIWDGRLSSVVGLQKRGLRGLMEGRRLRERLLSGRSVTLE